LAGPVFGLIEQPHYGWGSPAIYLPIIIGVLLFAGFLVYEKRAKNPMLPLDLFKNHNFSVGNVATLAIYAGLSASLFLLILFLQQVSGYSALAAGLANVPITLILFLLSPKMGELAGKYGPRLFMGIGPIIAGIGFLLMLQLGAQVDYWTELFIPIVVFGVGLSITVAPLVSAILGDVPKNQAGIASAVNNAVARVAGLIAVAAVGAVVAAQFGSVVSQKMQTSKIPSSSVDIAKQISLETKPPSPYQHDEKFKEALTEASVKAFHSGILTIAVLLIAGGAVSLVGIRNPARQA
jgi:Na+/melibiose symporter-like transporter